MGYPILYHLALLKLIFHDFSCVVGYRLVPWRVMTYPKNPAYIGVGYNPLISIDPNLLLTFHTSKYTFGTPSQKPSLFGAVSNSMALCSPKLTIRWLGPCKGADLHRTKPSTRLAKGGGFFVPMQVYIYMTCTWLINHHSPNDVPPSEIRV